MSEAKRELGRSIGKGGSDPVALVTGASGFLGLHLVDVLLAQGRSVRSLGRGESAELARRGVDQRVGSVTDAAACSISARHRDTPAPLLPA